MEKLSCMSIKQFVAHTSIYAFACALLIISGCGKEQKNEKITKEKTTQNSKKNTPKKQTKQSKETKTAEKPKKHSQREHMTYEELSDHITKALAKNRKKEAVPYLEEIASRFADRDDIAKHKLQLAELYFDTKDYAAAHEVFDHFAQFYPSDAQAEYAKFKAIKATAAQSLQMDCDQTETMAAAALCKEYLENPHFEAYRKDVVEIKRACNQKLIKKEIYVFNFYLRQDQFDAARNRLTYLKNTFAKQDNSLTPLLLELEYKLTSKQRHAASGAEKQRLEKELQVVAADIKKLQEIDGGAAQLQKLAEHKTKKEKEKSYWL